MNEFYLVTIDQEKDLQKLAHGVSHQLNQSVLITVDGESGAALLEVVDQSLQVTVNGELVLDVSHLQNGDTICADGTCYIFAPKMAAVIPNEPRLGKAERDRHFDLEAANLIFGLEEESQPDQKNSTLKGYLERLPKALTRKTIVRSAIGTLAVLLTCLFTLNWNKDAEAVDKHPGMQVAEITPSLSSKIDSAPAPAPAKVDPVYGPPRPQAPSVSIEKGPNQHNAEAEVEPAIRKPAPVLKKRATTTKRKASKPSVSKKLAKKIRQKIEEASLIAGYDPDRARAQLTKLRDSLPRGNQLRHLANRELGKL